MSLKRSLKSAGVSAAALLCGGVFMFGMAGPAGASTLTSPDGNTTLTTQGTVAAGTPYTSGQNVTLSVQANSVISTAALSAAGAPTTGNFSVYECTDPGGTVANLPTTPSGCEPDTVASVAKTPTGAVSLSGANSFVVFDLPDANLGTPSMAGTCDVAPNQCVVGIFATPIASGAFGFPHLFSAPFQVTVGDGADNGDSPGDGTPEVPLALLLPLAAAAVVGGGTVYERRRRRVATAGSNEK
jgi:hypothetical protein